jgi:hypothetical protein
MENIDQQKLQTLYRKYREAQSVHAFQELYGACLPAINQAVERYPVLKDHFSGASVSIGLAVRYVVNEAKEDEFVDRLKSEIDGRAEIIAANLERALASK